MLRRRGFVHSSSERAGAQAWPWMAERTRTHRPAWTRGLWTLRGGKGCCPIPLSPLAFSIGSKPGWSPGQRDYEATTGRTGYWESAIEDSGMEYKILSSQNAPRTSDLFMGGREGVRGGGLWGCGVVDKRTTILTLIATGLLRPSG